jgi:hypothetical protein
VARVTARRPLDERLAAEPILSRDHVEWGATRSRLRARDVTHPFRGVSIRGAVGEDPLSRARAFAPLMRPCDAFSHVTAALFHGAPLPRRLATSPLIHVTSVGDTRIRRPGVCAHRAARLQTVLVGGLRVVDAAHTWVQLATLLGHDDLVAVADCWLTPTGPWRYRRPALLTRDDLAAALAAHPGQRGMARARLAFHDVRVGAESPMETRLRLLLLRAGLPEPELNPALPVEGIELHPDLLFRQFALILEYEGDGHRTDPTAWRRDISRRERLQAAGFRVLQVHADDILRQPEQLIARVRRAIASAGR